MSKFTGNIIRLPAVTPTQNSASGVYTLDDQFTAQSSGTWPIVRDQYFNYTTLLLTGAVQGTAYPNPVTQPYSFLSDASTNNFVVSPNGDVSARPFNPYLNSYSNFYNGAGYFSSSTALFAYSTGSASTQTFTIEAMVFQTDRGTAPITLPYSQCIAGKGDVYMNFGINSSGNLMLLHYDGSERVVTSSATIPLNTWTYVAVTVSGGVVTLYINGTPSGTGTWYGLAAGGLAQSSFFGRPASNGNAKYFQGYIANLRVSSVVRTIAIPTSNYANDANTAFLFNQSNRFIDNSSNGYAITVLGSPAVSQNSPFVSYDTTNGSGYFDGTTDYLGPIGTTSSFNFMHSPTALFTFQCWICPTSLPSSGVGRGLFGTSDNSGQAGVQIGIENTGSATYVVLAISKAVGGTLVLVAYSTTALQANTWTHIAITYDQSLASANAKFYTNGVLTGTGNKTANTPSSGNAGQPGYIGQYATAAFNYIGYIADFRITNTIETITLPTAPVTPVSGTALLTLQTRAPATNNGFIDSSPNNFVVTRNGNTTQGSFSPFSQTGWGNYFDGTTDYLSIANNAALQLSNSVAWTVELWFYATALASEKAIFNGFNPSGSPNYNGFGLNLGSNGQPATTLMMYDGTNWTNIATVSANQWYHVAVSYEGSGTTRRCFLNGVLQGSAGTVPSTITNTSTATAIGALSNGNFSFPGYVSNVRVVKGQALYTGAFTPATSALTVSTVGATGAGVPTQTITGTVSLLTCQSNRFVDNSPNNFTITKNGDTSVQAFSPFAPAQSYMPSQIGGSGYFDGNGDWLSVADNTVLDMEASDFTMEAWIYPTASFSTNGALFSKRASNAVFGGVLVLFGGSNAPIFRATSTNSSWDLVNSTSSISVVPSQWNHVAIARSSGNWALWVNGNRGVSTTGATGTVSNNTAAFGIGANADSSESFPIPVYVAAARVVKGTAVYDPTLSTITVPTAPPTAIPNTSLLLNFTNGGIVDATGKNNLETVANSSVQTTQAKWSPGSMYFDGTGDYLTIPSSNLLAFGTGDFTLEFWVYPTSAAATNALIMWTTVGDYFALAMNTSRNVFLDRYGSTTLATTSNTLTLNTWNHVAVARLGATLQIYINGTSGASVANSTNWLASAIQIGNNGYTSYLFGYLDDLRITKGYARYATGTGGNAGQMVFNGTNTLALPTGPFPLG
jgi:hypothetical protein